MFPHFQDKHRHPSLITPKMSLEYRRQQGRFPTMAPPKTMIFCYRARFLKQVLEQYAYQACDGCFSNLYFLTDYPSVAIADFGIGAPQVAVKFEDLVAWGVEQFVSIGLAGAVSSKLNIGDIVLCDKAVRDEGTSYHYLPPAKYIHAPERMRQKLESVLKQLAIAYHVGSTWTTDSFYRQTAEEVRHYQNEGVLTVEMEAAALFAIAHYHQVDLSALFTISDTHADLEWKPHLDHPKTWEGLHSLLQAGLHITSHK